jgi:hypothetical protein
MDHVLNNPVLRKSSLLLLMALVLVFMGATLVAGEGLVQPDGRINQVAHFGGDALYCVDGDYNATNQYSDFGQGGFRLLNMEGQELWFVPAAQISAAVAEAKETGKGVLVAEGYGTYGPVTIHTYVTDENDDYFVFSGYDEFGKPNSLTFKFCIPVGPIPSEPGEGEEPCYELPVLYKAVTVIAQVPYEPCIPFDECYNELARQKPLGLKPIEGAAEPCVIIIGS